MMRTPRAIPAALLRMGVLLCCSPGAAAQPAESGRAPALSEAPHAEARDLSEFAESLRAGMGVPGLSIAACNSEKPIAWGVAGVRSIRGEDPIQRADRFHIGSLTKSITATLVARFVERGQLTWESTIAEIAPGLAERAPEPARAITMRQLLSHRSGLGDDRAGGQMLMQMWGLTGEITGQREKISLAYLKIPGRQEAGSDFAYANANYIIAGHLLEVIAGEPWEDLVAREVFEPLGLGTAGQGPPGLDPVEGPQPFGHGNGPQGYTPIPQVLGADNPPPLGPAGRVHMSAEDLAEYAQAHLRGLLGHEGILKPSTFEMLHADPESDGYALGWGIAGEGPTRRSVHSGSNTRWLALIMVWPERDLAVVACMNAVPPGDRTGDPLGAVTNELGRLGLIKPLAQQSAPASP